MRTEPYSGAAGEWDAFGRGQHGWTAFHSHGWKGIMEDVLGHSAPYLAARGEDGALQGILPLVEVRSVLFGHYLVSMPFLNQGGPVGSDEAVRALGDAAVRLAVERGADLLELRSATKRDLPLRVSHRKITVVLDLPEDPETLWTDLPSKVRSQIRRPRKAGCEVRFGQGQVDAFYEVFARHMKDLGTPVQSRALFRAMAETFPDDVRIGCVYYEGAPVACGFGFQWGDQLEITWASSLREHGRMAPNMLLYWGFMEQAIRDGARIFDFGRCTPGSGTHRFKGQWGSRDVPLWWYQQSQGDQEDAATPSPDAGIYALGTRLWKRLPLPVANALGPGIVRLIP